MTRCALFAAVLVTFAAIPDSGRAADASVQSGAEKEGKLVVYSTTDSAIVSALIKDFGAAYPKIPLEYNDMNSTELYNRFLSEAAAGARSAHLPWSSAMELPEKAADRRQRQEDNRPAAAPLPP